MAAVAFLVRRETKIQPRLADEARDDIGRHQIHGFAAARVRTENAARTEIAGSPFRAVLAFQQFRVGRQADLEQRIVGSDRETQHAEAIVDRFAIGSDECHD